MIKINPKTKISNKEIRTTLKRTKEKAYIVGGGPSINIPSLSKLSDGDIIAVNKAIDYFNKVNFFVTIDYSFLSSKTNFNNLIKKADNSVFIVNKSNKYILKKADGHYYDIRFKLRYTHLKRMTHVLESKNIDPCNGETNVRVYYFCEIDFSGKGETFHEGALVTFDLIEGEGTIFALYSYDLDNDGIARRYLFKSHRITFPAAGFFSLFKGTVEYDPETEIVEIHGSALIGVSGPSYE